MQLTNITTVRELMQRHNMRFSKSLGQNFIINPAICPKIAELGGANPSTCVLEIGPGIGVLTAELAKRAQKVVTIELDSKLPPLLEESLAEFSNVKIISGDAMTLDLRRIIAEEFGGMEVVVCANLPYYITSPLLMRLLEERLPLSSITVMVQKEAAQRICAPLPSRQAGAITAAVAWYSQPSILFQVARGSFLPPPKVDSTVIRLDMRSAPPVDVADEALLFQIIRGSFAQRRKTLLNSLASSLDIEKDRLRALLAQAGLDPQLRAEQLSLEDFARIANAM